MNKFNSILSALVLTAASTGAMAGQFATSEEAYGGPEVQASIGQEATLQYAVGSELGGNVEVTPSKHQMAGIQFQDGSSIN